MRKTAVQSAMALALAAGALRASAVQTVHFLSEDHKTKLVGYVFSPEGGGRHAAVVMLHGRAGPYSSAAKGVYTAQTLSKRHQEWGRFWAERGYVAMLVDSFGPRGYPQGFPAGSYENRPEAVSEQTVRPLDAYGAMRYLRERKDVAPERIGLQGWSNGAMTVLVTMNQNVPAEMRFRVALAEYPGCGMEAISGGYRPYSPVLLIVASADAEVSPKRCVTFAQRAKRGGADLEFVEFEGAEHNFDDPGKAKQANAANRRATEQTMLRADQLFAKALRP